MKFLLNCCKGIIIGSGIILPGISSGILCMIMGIYEKILDSILYFFKDIKKNFKFLVPLVIGSVIGILLFSNILKYLIYKYPIQLNSIFIGLIIGSIPSLIKEINSKEKFKKIHIIYFLISFFFGVLIVLFEKSINIASVNNINEIYLFICGIIMSVGFIVPGVSSTIILMLLGIYTTYLQSISVLYFPVLIPMGMGLIIGSMFWIYITKILLNKYYAKTTYTIIGFTLGSILVLIPQTNNMVEVIISILSVLLGFNIVKLLIKN